MNKNYDFFKSILPELLVKQPGKFVVIKDEKVIGVYDDFDKAYEETSKKEPLGTFIIQEVVDEICCKAHFASDTVSFSQRVI